MPPDHSVKKPYVWQNPASSYIMTINPSEEVPRMVITLTSENFNTVVKESALPVLVDFWAEWCTPCHRLDPILDELAEETEGKAVICRLEVDRESEIADLYEIMSIPTLIVFENGKPKDIMVGLKGKAALKAALGL
jgi:thioredoxin 1